MTHFKMIAGGLVSLAACVGIYACNKDSPTEPTPSCTVTISPAALAFEAAGGEGVVTVSAAQGCAWTATANASWISVTQGGQGSGTAVVKYTVAANAGTGARAGTLTIGTQVHAIAQQAQTAGCTMQLSPTSASPANSGGVGEFAVTTQANCPWSAVSSDEAWISITAGREGRGSGTVSYLIASNASAASRRGAIAVGDQVFLISQAGTTCSYSVWPGSAAFSAAGGSGTFSVAAGAGCGWTATSTEAWVAVTSAADGSGNGVVNFRVEANGTPRDRTATILVGDKTFTITQSGDVSSCSYEVTPVNVSACMVVPSMMSAIITTQASCPWTASASEAWLTLAQTSGAGSGTVNFSLDPNWDVPRAGVVMVRWPTATAGQNVHVAQAGCRYAVSRNAVAMGAGGGSERVEVYQTSDPIECGGPLQNACRWTAESNASWIRITSGLPRAGDDALLFNVDANPGPEARSGSILVRGVSASAVNGKVVVITQAGAGSRH